MPESLARHIFSTIFIALLTVVFGGCSKSAQTTASSGAIEGVALTGGDLNPDGTISAAGLKIIGTKSDLPAFNITVVRSRLSDAGLRQLAAYKNLKRLDAIGSTLSADAINKLKKAVPDVEVTQ